MAVVAGARSADPAATLGLIMTVTVRLVTLRMASWVELTVCLAYDLCTSYPSIRLSHPFHGRGLVVLVANVPFSLSTRSYVRRSHRGLNRCCDLWSGRRASASMGTESH